MFSICFDTRALTEIFLRIPRSAHVTAYIDYCDYFVYVWVRTNNEKMFGEICEEIFWLS